MRDLLEGANASVYLADYSLSPGEMLAASMEQAIGDCDLFVLLWSAHAKKSEWVSQEIGIAKAKDKPVIPVLLHKNLEAPGFLKGVKYLPLYTNPQEGLEWLKKHVYEKADAKTQKNGLLWMGIGAAVLMLLGRGTENEDV